MKDCRSSSQSTSNGTWLILLKSGVPFPFSLPLKLSYRENYPAFNRHSKRSFLFYFRSFLSCNAPLNFLLLAYTYTYIVG